LPRMMKARNSSTQPGRCTRNGTVVRSLIDIPPFQPSSGAADLFGECLYLSNAESGTSTFGKYYASAPRESINACLRRGARSRRHWLMSVSGS
jgi:hypothetical protein